VDKGTIRHLNFKECEVNLMHCAIKSKKLSFHIIFSIFLWIILFHVNAWAAPVPGDGNAVDGTIRNVEAEQIARGAQITQAPSISQTSDVSKNEQITAPPAAVSSHDSAGSPVLVCGSGKASISPASQINSNTPKKGTSLGMFVTTGYCICEECSGGFDLTYSGTVPQARHTISADITRFPIGTRLMIHDIIYTVEDIGSNVIGEHIDIYYDNHEDAVAHGKQIEEVFMVE
jgi:3D (Asp-Asp-Asp) domain-containing protein